MDKLIDIAEDQNLALGVRIAVSSLLRAVGDAEAAGLEVFIDQKREYLGGYMGGAAQKTTAFDVHVRRPL